MRKSFAVLSILCFIIFGSVIFSACGKSSYNITLTSPEDVKVELFDGEKSLQSENNVFKVSSKAKITVKVYATVAGQDLSSLVITVNGKEKDRETDLVFYQMSEEDLLYCSFALPMVQLQQNIELNLAL